MERGLAQVWDKAQNWGRGSKVRGHHDLLKSVSTDLMTEIQF